MIVFRLYDPSPGCRDGRLFAFLDVEAFLEGQNQFFDKREEDNHEKFRQV
jgi:hypothetical protein